jgi:hypothetical protein
VRQSRLLAMTAEAGALDRYRKPIWTAGLQGVVLPWIMPWITPSGGRLAAVRMESGRDKEEIHSWTETKGAGR